MPREAIDLGNPERLQSGKIRYKKMFRRRQWKSSAYDNDSRRSRSMAWAEFVEWREQIKQEIEARQLLEDEQHPLKKHLVEHLQEEIALAITTENEKQQKWASDALSIVRKADETGLYESAELLGIPLPGEESPEHQSARNVVRSIVSKSKTIKAEFQTSKLISSWLVFRISDVIAGDITAGAVNNQRMQLERFAEFCPNILAANGMKVAEFRASLQSSELAKTTQRDTLTTVKSFLEWCADTAEVIEPMSCLKSNRSFLCARVGTTLTGDSDVELVESFQRL